MIKRINFLQESAIGALSYKLMLIISLFIIISLSGIYGIQSSRASKLQNTLSSLVQEIATLKSKSGVNPNLKAGTLSPVEAVSIEMVAEPAWPEILRAISQSIEEGIWLDEIVGESASAKDPSRIILEGVAYQARLIPGFLDRLRSYNIFSSVNLPSSEATKGDVEASQNFKIEAKLKY